MPFSNLNISNKQQYLKQFTEIWTWLVHVHNLNFCKAIRASQDMITWQTKFICRWTFRFAIYFSIDIETYMLCNSGMDFSKNWICFNKLYFMFIIIIIKECFNLEIIDDKWSRPIEEIYLLFTKFLTWDQLFYNTYTSNKCYSASLH